MEPNITTFKYYDTRIFLMVLQYKKKTVHAYEDISGKISCFGNEGVKEAYLHIAKQNKDFTSARAGHKMQISHNMQTIICTRIKSSLES